VYGDSTAATGLLLASHATTGTAVRRAARRRWLVLGWLVQLDAATTRTAALARLCTATAQQLLYSCMYRTLLLVDV
jgi:hypothetical protein